MASSLIFIYTELGHCLFTVCSENLNECPNPQANQYSETVVHILRTVHFTQRVLGYVFD